MNCATVPAIGRSAIRLFPARQTSRKPSAKLILTGASSQRRGAPDDANTDVLECKTMPLLLDKSPAFAVVIAASLLLASLSQAQAEPATFKSAPTPAELIDALRNKPTRGASPASSTAEIAETARLISALKEKTTRGMSISTQERQQLASVITTQPAVNLEIGFEFNSSKLKPDARAALKSLGIALKDGQLANADILIAGHTDAKGRPPVNQWLSERRAASVRTFLVKNYGLANDKLISVGYGSERLKNPTRPFADENRRVQIVNMTR